MTTETKSKHTPGPWKIAPLETDIEIGSKHYLHSRVSLVTKNEIEEAKANAQRIVKCVNALAGLNPEGVREAVAALKGGLSVLSEFYEGCDHEAGLCQCGVRDTMRAMSDALAKLGVES